MEDYSSVSYYSHTAKSPIAHDRSNNQSPLLRLPAELRIQILGYLFLSPPQQPVFHNSNNPGGLLLNSSHTAPFILQPLLACRQLNDDAHTLGYTTTNFILHNVFIPVEERLSTCLAPTTLRLIRHITLVADQRHFRSFATWGNRPFGLADLELRSLTLVLTRSSFPHYLFDFTQDFVSLLRVLKGVAKLEIIRNGARVKGGWRAWYNRLVGQIMKIDHAERFERQFESGTREATWWNWEFHELQQRISLRALEPKEDMLEEEYMVYMRPRVEEWRESVEAEEWNSDPRSRMLYP